MRRHQSGFTLIEIAIVLVIIGLLLGGILKGQELINSARVKNLAADFRNIPVFIYGYQDKFKALPGDDASHFRADGLNDAPAAKAGADAHGESADDDDPPVDDKRGDRAAGQQGHGKHAHELLTVVEAMVEGHETGGEHLQPIK